MALTEHEALENARQFAQRIQARLEYPIRDVPSRKKREQDTEPPTASLEGAPIGRDFWIFDFDYELPPNLFREPDCIRILVDAHNGDAAEFCLM